MNLHNPNSKSEYDQEASPKALPEVEYEMAAESSDQTPDTVIEAAEQTPIAISGAGRAAVRASMAALADQVWRTTVYPGILGDVSNRPSL